MKNQIVLPLIALIIIGFFSPIQAMDTEQDPYRFGPICISEPLTDADRAEAQERIRKGYMWHKKRIYIAKVIRCGDQATQFLHESVCQNDYYMIKDLLEHGANPNVSSNYCYPLIFESRIPLIASLLIHHGANYIHGSIIHFVCRERFSPALLQYYLEFPTLNVNARDDLTHSTPLHAWALTSFRENERHLPEAREKLRMLIRAGARFNHKNKDGQTPLDVLIKRRDEYSSYEHMGTWSPWMARPWIAGYNVLIEDLRKAMGPEPFVEPELQKADKYQHIFPCTHTSHSACIQKWISTTCPLCRATME